MVPSFEQIGRFCHRYGPGKLPRADERAIGAGYAGASAAIVAALTFASVSALAGNLVVGGASDFAPFGLAAIPLIVPGAFVAGWATWGYLPAETTYLGPIAGSLTVLLTYVIATVLLLPVLLVTSLLSRPPFIAVETSLVLGALIGWIAFAATCWLTLPLGVTSGYVYERARAATD